MRKRIPLIFLIIAIIVLSSTALLLNIPAIAQPPKPINGILDLSNWSFEKNGIVSLKGIWSFYYNRFLTHEDFAKGVDAIPTPIEIPSTMKSIAHFKPFSRNDFYGTLNIVC